MNITLSIDQEVADRARQAAQAMGKSLNQAVREYLERLAGEQQRAALAQAYERSALQTPGRLAGWRINRDEMNERA